MLQVPTHRILCKLIPGVEQRACATSTSPRLTREGKNGLGSPPSFPPHHLQCLGFGPGHPRLWPTPLFQLVAGEVFTGKGYKPDSNQSDQELELTASKDRDTEPLLKETFLLHPCSVWDTRLTAPSKLDGWEWGCHEVPSKRNYV